MSHHIGKAAGWRTFFEQHPCHAADLDALLRDFATLEQAYHHLLTALQALTADALVVHGVPSRVPPAPEAPLGTQYGVPRVPPVTGQYYGG
jgi:hypothetical protein